MGILDDALKLKGTPGMAAVALGGVVLIPILLPVIGSVLKPLIKTGIKGGIIVYRKGKETAAVALGSLEDIAAEAKAEVIEAQK